MRLAIQSWDSKSVGKWVNALIKRAGQRKTTSNFCFVDPVYTWWVEGDPWRSCKIMSKMMEKERIKGWYITTIYTYVAWWYSPPHWISKELQATGKIGSTGTGIIGQAVRLDSFPLHEISWVEMVGLPTFSTAVDWERLFNWTKLGSKPSWLQMTLTLSTGTRLLPQTTLHCPVLLHISKCPVELALLNVSLASRKLQPVAGKSVKVINY